MSWARLRPPPCHHHLGRTAYSDRPELHARSWATVGKASATSSGQKMPAQRLLFKKLGHACTMPLPAEGVPASITNRNCWDDGLDGTSFNIAPKTAHWNTGRLPCLQCLKFCDPGSFLSLLALLGPDTHNTGLVYSCFKLVH